MVNDSSYKLAYTLWKMGGADRDVEHLLTQAIGDDYGQEIQKGGPKAEDGA